MLFPLSLGLDVFVQENEPVFEVLQNVNHLGRGDVKINTHADS